MKKSRASSSFNYIALVTAFCTVFSSACSDSFKQKFAQEEQAQRAKSASFSLITGTTVISFTESGDPGTFTAHLSAPPLSDVVIDFLKANQKCTPEEVTETLLFSPEKLVFTPQNFKTDQSVKISVSDDPVVTPARHHELTLPTLESSDPLYNGVPGPVIDVTVFEDDTKPLAYPTTPYINETDVPVYNDIVINFNRSMDQSTIDSSNFQLLDSTGTFIDAYIRLSSDGKTAILSPKCYLKNNNTYSVSMTSQVKDLDGNQLYEELDTRFTTNLYQIPVKGKVTFSSEDPSPMAMAVKGDYAYISMGNELRILDISNPEQPEKDGSLLLPDLAFCIAISGNYAYVPVCTYHIEEIDNRFINISDTSNLLIIDITNPKQPFIFKNVPLTSTIPVPAAIAVSTNYVCLTNLSAGCEMVDISDPENPLLTDKKYQTNDDLFSINDVKLSEDGTYIYAANNRNGDFYIIQTNNMNLVGSTTTDIPDSGAGIAVKGNYAYIADGTTGGLYIIDISNPVKPSKVSQCTLPGYAYSIALSQSYAFVSTKFASSNTVEAIEISDPLNPVHMGTADTGEITAGIDCSEMDTRKNLLYVATPGGVDPIFKGFKIMDAYNDVPALRKTFALSYKPFYISISGNNLGIAGQSENGYQWLISSNFSSIDITNPLSPVIQGTASEYRGLAADGVVSGNYGYLLGYNFWDYNGGELDYISIYDFSTSTPFLFKSFTTLNFTYTFLAVSENYAYVTAKDGTADERFIQVFDMNTGTDLGNRFTFTNTLGAFMNIDTYKNNLYVARKNGVQILDISDKTSPVEKCTYTNLTGRAQYAIGNENYVIILDNYPSDPDLEPYLIRAYTLRIVDISNPAAPFETGTCNIPATYDAVSITVYGNYAYILDPGAASSIFIISLKDKSKPAVITKYSIPDYLSSIAVKENYIYASAPYAGSIRIIRHPYGE